MEDKKVRLQKYLANQGIASRRKCEEYISQGIVKVNGEVVTELGTKIDPDVDRVEVDENTVEQEKESYVYIMLNKPRGYITSLKQSDSNSPLVVDLVKGHGRIYPVGRLDKDSSGLLILTNDGELTYRLMHPSFEKEKEYHVTARDPIPESVIERFRKGVKIDGRVTAKAKVKRISGRKISLVLTEGRNRQIRKMFTRVGNEVEFLHRVRVKNLELGDLKVGSYRLLTEEEVKSLQ